MVGLFFITVLGIILRLVGIDKPEGLWNDEYISWFVASHPFGGGFLTELKAQCHMPFYYLYLKAFMAWGGQSDLLLRLSSVAAGALSIIVMYFVGAQKNKKIGLIAALMTSISSFLIYYSQEVRLYSVLFLFSALSLLYFIKFLNNKCATNLGGLILFDFLIMFTHTIGFVFVFFQLAALSVLLFKEYKKQLSVIWLSIGVLAVLSVPLISSIFTTKSFSQWWGSFSISKIGFLLTDYFSPVLTNLVNAPDKFFYVHSLSFVFFTTVPALIALFLIIKSIIKNRTNTLLLASSVGFVCVLVIVAIAGRLVFITKYSIEIYPILIFLAAYGVDSFNKKFIGNILISIFCAINLTYLILSPVSAPKMPRPQGHKIVADMIRRAQPKSGDVILLEYYPYQRFTKYIDFSSYNVMSIDKGTFPMFLAPDVTYQDVVSDGKNLYKDMFQNKKSGYLEAQIDKHVLNNLKQNQSVIVISSDSVSFYPPEVLNKISNDPYLYQKTPIMYMIFSYIKNHVFLTLSKKLSVTRFERAGDWSLVRFTKLNK